jgi:orotidine-5'-phosphate decarboxylase
MEGGKELDRLVVALDVPSVTEAHRVLGLLGETVTFYKVGLELLADPEVGDLLDTLRRSGKKIFLDLKLHDIPRTVAAAVRGWSARGITCLTVHVAGGDMVAAAVEAAAGRCAVLGVTVLTSMAAPDLLLPGSKDLSTVVLERARMAQQAGCAGVVVSGLEAGAVRATLGPDLELYVPGVREVGAPTDDQRRVVSAAEAVAAGADHIILGRPVLGAPDPLKAVQRLRLEIARGLAAHQKGRAHAE